MNDELRSHVSRAVAHCWRSVRQRTAYDNAPIPHEELGSDSAAAGRQQERDGLIGLIRNIVTEAGLSKTATYEKDARLPGHFRPATKWDLAVTAEGHLIAAFRLELEAVPSLGADFDERAARAIASAMDTWAVCRKGTFKDSLRPWLGYFILLEDTERSRSPVSVKEPHFGVFPEFRNASYVKRYELLCQRLVREGLYNAACLLTSPAEGGVRGEFAEPCAEISVAPFFASLTGHVTAHSKLREHKA